MCIFLKSFAFLGMRISSTEIIIKKFKLRLLTLCSDLIFYRQYFVVHMSQ